MENKVIVMEFRDIVPCEVPIEPKKEEFNPADLIGEQLMEWRCPRCEGLLRTWKAEKERVLEEAGNSKIVKERYYKCRDCGLRFITQQPFEEIIDVSEVKK